MPTARETRIAANKLAAETRKAAKLHAIAERRAKAAKMTKAEYIAGIVARRFPGITAEDIANEPTPETEAT
jgi:hypothetical protein